MKTAAAYIRVSTDGQLEYSPDSQLKVIRDYAEKHSLRLPEAYIFREEEGISGKQAEKRPAFMQMIGAAKQKPKPFDCIILWKFSRFARSRRDSIVYKTMLRKQLGIDVVSVTEQLGDDNLSILMEAVIEAMDEYYSINLAEEVKRGMLEKVSRGEPVTPPAFGYKIQEKQYVPDPEASHTVHVIFQWYTQGISCSEIAQRLNALGIRTNRGRPWEPRAVKYLLRNPVYIGKLRWNAQGASGRETEVPNSGVMDGTHIPLIEPTLWEETQARLPYKVHRERDISVKDTYSLRGLIFCSACGAPLVKTSRAALQCRGYAHDQCSISHYVPIHRLEEMVFCALEADLPNCMLTRAPSPAADNTAMVQAQMVREQKKLDRLREAYEAGAETLAEYQKEKEHLQKQLAALSAEQARISTASTILESQVRLFTLLRSETLTGAEKNRLLCAILDQVVFDAAQKHLKIYYRMECMHL